MGARRSEGEVCRACREAKVHASQSPIPGETAADLQREIDQLHASMTGVRRSSSWGPNRVWVEIGPQGYLLVFHDPNERVTRNVVVHAAQRDDFLYQILRADARAAAKAGEPIRNDHDHRRVIFEGSIERLRRIEPRRDGRERIETEKALMTEPYDDAKWKRVARVNALKKQGRAEAEANQLAAQEFPWPYRNARRSG